MKKNIKVKIAGIAVILLTLFTSSFKMNAQCGPYVIKNQTNCHIVVNMIYTCGGSPCAGAGPAGIPPGGQINVPVCSCTSGCAITVQLTQVKSTTFSTPPSVAPGTNTTYNSSICPSSGTMSFSGSVVTIN